MPKGKYERKPYMMTHCRVSYDKICFLIRQMGFTWARVQRELDCSPSSIKLALANQCLSTHNNQQCIKQIGHDLPHQEGNECWNHD
jgi:hypothetical protein